MKKVSVIIPTHTGIDTIKRCLGAVLKQTVAKNVKLETVVVIDGPNSLLQEKVNSMEPVFKRRGVNLKIKGLPNNRGVFQAILAGARIADADWLIIVGDRVMLTPDYLVTAILLDEDAIIPWIMEENWDDSPISIALYLIRKWLYAYGDKKSNYTYITDANFEKAPKGTGGLWIGKELYLSVCAKMTKHDASKHGSDDTKFLRILVDMNKKILRSEKLKVVYVPRLDIVRQLKHIYNRGPKFAYYYLQPGKRFFVPLILSFILPIIFAASLLINFHWLYVWLVVALLLIAVVTVYLAEKPRQVLILAWSIPLMTLAFYAGILKGMILTLTNAKD